jgi:hypothetical protein
MLGQFSASVKRRKVRRVPSPPREMIRYWVADPERPETWVTAQTGHMGNSV